MDGSTSVPVNGSVVAFCLGAVWAVILIGYGTVSDVSAVPLEDERVSRAHVVLDVLFVGGGTGVVIGLTDVYLSSFGDGFAGLVLVAVVAAIGRR